jgi:hypothetical protein
MANRRTPTPSEGAHRRAGMRTARAARADVHVRQRGLAGLSATARAKMADAGAGEAGQPPDRPAPEGAFRKVSVTIPDAVVEEARARAGRGGLSAYVASAVEAQLAADRLRDLLTHLDSVYGPVPEEMIAQAEAAWPSEDGDR